MVDTERCPQEEGARVACDTIAAAGEAMLADLALSPNSKQTYLSGIRAFQRYLGGETLPLSVIDENTLAGFARWLRETYPDPRAREGEDLGVSATARLYLIAAGRIMNWLDLRNLLPAGLSYDRMARRAQAVRGQRRQGYQTRRVDPDVMRVLTHFLDQPLPLTSVQRINLLRNRALVAMLYDTAARIRELLALTREDVLDGRAERIRLTRTKNGKPRFVFLSPDTRQLITDYIHERGTRSSIDNAFTPLFVSHMRQAKTSGLRLTALSPTAVRKIIKYAAVAEGLYENTSPHSFRHRRAQDLLDGGMPLEWVAAYLGHEHPSTTRIIYAWETDVNRLEEMVAAHGKTPTQAATEKGGAH